VEQQLITSISVLLPARKLVVDCKRDTFLEAVAGPGSKADDVAIDLETQGHVEIFGNVRFRPELLVAIFVKVGDLLNGGPAEDGVVADKGGDVAVGDGIGDGGVDEVGEERDAGKN
jgi:hypothetical protein